MTDKIIRKIQISSAQNRVVLISVAFVFISVMIIGIHMAIVLYTNSLETTYEKMTIYVDKTLENIEQTFSFVSNTALAVAGQDTVLTWIDNPYVLDRSNPNFYKNLYKMNSEIKYVLSYSSAWRNNFISYISIYVDDQIVSCITAKPFTNKEIINMSNNAYDKIYKNYGNQNLPPFVNTTQMYHALKLKYDFSSDKSLVILIAMEESALRDHYSDVLTGYNSKSYLIDENNVVFSSSDISLKGQKISDQIIDNITYNKMNSFVFENERCVSIAKKLDKTNLTFINMVPHENIVKAALKDLPSFLVLTVILCIIILIIGIIINRKSTAFITDLAYAMDCVKKENYDIRMPYYSNQAINVLSDSFNSMTSEMKKLIKRTYESKIMLQEMEIQFLQQQIKPHFLFSILLIIQIKAKQREHEAVYKMLASLSGLLRASLYSGNNIYSTLEEELKCVEYYLYLQKQRLKDKLIYELKIDKTLLDTKIPRLSIEPIVENAVIHGRGSLDKTIHLTVDVMEKHDDLYIEVIDDGVGFDVENLDLSDNNIKDNNIREKIGLKNTNSRLQLLYGKDYGIDIKSQKNKGTKITIRIPKQQD